MIDPDAFKAAIRSVLLNDWDPHNASRSEAGANTYDEYIAPLADMILSDADEKTIIQWLHEREKETMCFPSLGTSRLVRVARLLRKLHHTADLPLNP